MVEILFPDKKKPYCYWEPKSTGITGGSVSRWHFCWYYLRKYKLGLFLALIGENVLMSFLVVDCVPALFNLITTTISPTCSAIIRQISREMNSLKSLYTVVQNEVLANLPHSSLCGWVGGELGPIGFPYRWVAETIIAVCRLSCESIKLRNCRFHWALFVLALILILHIIGRRRLFGSGFPSNKSWVITL